MEKFLIDIMKLVLLTGVMIGIGLGALSDYYLGPGGDETLFVGWLLTGMGVAAYLALLYTVKFDERRRKK